MKTQNLSLSLKGHVKALEFSRGFDMFMDRHNDISPNALTLLTRALAGETNYQIDTLSLHSSASSNPDGLVESRQIEFFSFPEPGVMEALVIFPPSNNTGIIDEIRLSSAFHGTFSSIKNLSIQKLETTAIAFKWKIRVGINGVECPDCSRDADCSNGPQVTLDYQNIGVFNVIDTQAIVSPTQLQMDFPINKLCCPLPGIVEIDDYISWVDAFAIDFPPSVDPTIVGYPGDGVLQSISVVPIGDEFVIRLIFEIAAPILYPVFGLVYLRICGSVIPLLLLGILENGSDPTPGWELPGGFLNDGIIAPPTP